MYTYTSYAYSRERDRVRMRHEIKKKNRSSMILNTKKLYCIASKSGPTKKPSLFVLYRPGCITNDLEYGWNAWLASVAETNRPLQVHLAPRRSRHQASCALTSSNLKELRYPILHRVGFWCASRLPSTLGDISADMYGRM